MKREEDQISDERLIDRTLAGESAAFGELVARYQDRLYGAAVAILHDPDEAKDVVQETFLQAYANLAQFRRTSRFYTWLYRISFNVAVGVLRQKKRSIPANRLLDTAWESVTGKEESPENRQTRQETVQILWNAIERLPIEYRKAIVLREIDGASYEEIAEAVDIPLGTVRSRLYRARTMLRDIITRFKNDLS